MSDTKQADNIAPYFIGTESESQILVWGKIVAANTDKTKYVCELYRWESEALAASRNFTMTKDQMRDFFFYPDVEQIGIALMSLFRTAPEKENQNEA